jgi:hypothetical protein
MGEVGRQQQTGANVKTKHTMDIHGIMHTLWPLTPGVCS